MGTRCSACRMGWDKDQGFGGSGNSQYHNLSEILGPVFQRPCLGSRDQDSVLVQARNPGELVLCL